MTAAAHAPARPSAAAELRRGDASVRVAVEPGASIISYRVGGVDWCAAGPWREYAPTLSACVLPTFVAGAPRTPFPEGGLLAAEDPQVDVHADGSVHTITATWPALAYPLAWTRVIVIEADGALTVRYAVTNEQRTRLPFVWGCQLPLPWSGALTLDMPRGARSRVAMSSGEGLARTGSEFAWPALRDGGRLADLTRPASLESRRAALCYIELPRGRVAIHHGDAALEISGDAGVVTHAHVWVNNDADTPGDAPRRWWRRRHVQRAVAVGPSVGAPALLSEAVGAWRAARWIEPGETLRWAVRYRPISPTTEPTP